MQADIKQSKTTRLNTQREQARLNMQRETARFNMIEQQIRTWEVLDTAVLELLKQVPRENFVPAQYAGLAFADLEIPIGEGQSMLSPKMEARIIQALEISKNDKVLEIGTGSGYLTALLATLAKEVISIEIRPTLSTLAKQRLKKQQIENAVLKIGDAVNGWAAQAPYDVIVFTGSLPIGPDEPVLQSMTVGGRLFAVTGEGEAMQAILIQRISAADFKRDVLFETRVPALDNASQPERFSF